MPLHFYKFNLQRINTPLHFYSLIVASNSGTLAVYYSNRNSRQRPVLLGRKITVLVGKFIEGQVKLQHLLKGSERNVLNIY